MRQQRIAKQVLRIARSGKPSGEESRLACALREPAGGDHRAQIIAQRQPAAQVAISRRLDRAIARERRDSQPTGPRGGVEIGRGFRAPIERFERAGDQCPGIGRRSPIARCEAGDQFALAPAQRQGLGEKARDLAVIGLGRGKARKGLCRARMVPEFEIEDAAEHLTRRRLAILDRRTKIEIARERQITAPRRDHRLEVEQARRLGRLVRHFAQDGQRIARPAYLAQIGRVIGLEVQIVGRDLQCTFKPRKRGERTIGITNQLGAKLEGRRAVGINCERAIRRRDGLNLFAAAIPQMADIDPQIRPIRIDRKRLIESGTGDR